MPEPFAMRRALILAGLLAVSPALGHARPHGPHPPVPVRGEAVVHHAQAPGHNPLDCYCRAQGRMFAPGESICLRTPQGARMAECQMVINVMSWGLTDRPCPDS